MAWIAVAAVFAMAPSVGVSARPAASDVATSCVALLPGFANAWTIKEFQHGATPFTQDPRQDPAGGGKVFIRNAARSGYIAFQETDWHRASGYDLDVGVSGARTGFEIARSAYASATDPAARETAANRDLSRLTDSGGIDLFRFDDYAAWSAAHAKRMSWERRNNRVVPADLPDTRSRVTIDVLVFDEKVVKESAAELDADAVRLRLALRDRRAYVTAVAAGRHAIAVKTAIDDFHRVVRGSTQRGSNDAGPLATREILMARMSAQSDARVRFDATTVAAGDAAHVIWVADHGVDVADGVWGRGQVRVGTCVFVVTFRMTGKPAETWSATIKDLLVALAEKGRPFALQK